MGVGAAMGETAGADAFTDTGAVAAIVAAAVPASN